MLVLDHLVVGACTGLRQFHLGDELFNGVLPAHVLDAPHPLVDFGRQLHLRRCSRCRFRCGILLRRTRCRSNRALLLVSDSRFACFLVLARCTLLLIDHDRTPFVESASRVQQTALQGNGSEQPRPARRPAAGNRSGVGCRSCPNYPGSAAIPATRYPRRHSAFVILAGSRGPSSRIRGQ